MFVKLINQIKVHLIRNDMVYNLMSVDVVMIASMRPCVILRPIISNIAIIMLVIMIIVEINMLLSMVKYNTYVNNLDNST